MAQEGLNSRGPPRYSWCSATPGAPTRGMSTAGSVACVASSMMTCRKRMLCSRFSSPAPVHVEHTTCTEHGNCRLRRHAVDPYHDNHTNLIA